LNVQPHPPDSHRLINPNLNALFTVVPLHLFYDRELEQLLFTPSSTFGEGVYLAPWWSPGDFELGAEPPLEKRYISVVSRSLSFIALRIPL